MSRDDGRRRFLREGAIDQLRTQGKGPRARVQRGRISRKGRGPPIAELALNGKLR